MNSSVKRFIKYVEMLTKITSLFPFLLTLAFILYQKQTINIGLTFIFFCSMFIFDLATTAINNYIDSKTNGQDIGFSQKTGKLIIFSLLIISSALGLLLALKTDLFILLLGFVCFAVGILYTYGPVPLSRQPLGEIFSGFFYGAVIPFIILYINLPKGTYFTAVLYGFSINLNINLISFLVLALFSITPAFATANIMLANNICDVEKDVLVKRYTLPYYLGKKSLSLFAFLYYACFASTIFLVVFKIFPPLCLISLFAFIPVFKNIKKFSKLQDKEKTFILSVKNFILLLVPNIILLLIARLFL